MSELSLRIHVIDPICRGPVCGLDPMYFPQSREVLKRVPLLQIFGVSSNGERLCVVVHGIMPTIYVDAPSDEGEQALFRTNILDFIRKNYPNAVLVYSTEFIKSTSIYGYHHESTFMKIELLSPQQQKHISDTLSTFVWAGHKINSYEGHIPFFMQFMVKYNLTGCGKMTIKHSRVTSSISTKYASEIHCHVSEIVVVPTDNGSNLLSHLNLVWEDQREIRRAMSIDTQAPITGFPRADLIFTQRPPPVDTQATSNESLSEMAELLEFLEKYDQGITPESLEKDEMRTQAEIENLKSDPQMIFHTLESFVEPRVSGSFATPTRSRQKVTSPAASLIREPHILEYRPAEKEIIEEPQHTDSQLEGMLRSMDHASQDLLAVFVEIGVQTRANFRPDSKRDPVNCICYVKMQDQEILDRGAFIVGKNVRCGFKCQNFLDEKSMIDGLRDYILRADPDILVGYDLERESLTYIRERVSLLGGNDWFLDISRMKERLDSFDLVRQCPGRILINLWRMIKFKENLRNYTFQTVCLELLGIPFPKLNNVTMNGWYSDTPFRYVDMIMKKVDFVVKIMNKKNYIDQYAELALILGLDISSTLCRGSQFYIESLLSRVSSRMGYLLMSPTSKDVAKQRAPMSLPLVMEPLSGCYLDPVMVLDFQSLYPSAMIAYNLDYSTLIGRTEIAAHGGQVGCTDLRVDPNELNQLVRDKKIINTPNDVLFVTTQVRKGVMPTMLQQMLNLRVYIKQTLKSTTDPKMVRVLDARQMALKMFLACAYGYTSAHFSGRMPCVDLSDSIVECSRHMLEYVVTHIDEKYPELKVLYGDTDSLFIQMPQAPMDKLFEYAGRIANEITSFFPSPIKIKLEKIYKGIFLVNKKRYCGWMFESPTQKAPTMDVKGLEIKRRDNCLLTANVMTKVIETIFQTNDLDLAKFVFLQEIERICDGRVPLHEFLFAKELRLGTYKAQIPPGAHVAQREMAKDPKAEPLIGERRFYVVVSTSPKAHLYEKVLSPDEFVEKKARISTQYYIMNQIVPSLGRVLATIGINLADWLKGISIDLHSLSKYVLLGKNVTAMERFCRSTICPLCGKVSPRAMPICDKCMTTGGRNECLYELVERKKKSSIRLLKVNRICHQCIGEIGTACNSTHCIGCKYYWKRELYEESVMVYQSFIDAFELSASTTPRASQK